MNTPSTTATTASDASSDRFGLLELDLDGKPGASPAAPGNVLAAVDAMIAADDAQAASVSTPRVGQFAPVTGAMMDEVVVSDTVRDLASKEHAVAQAAGFKIASVDSGLFFQAGTKLWDIGDASLQRYKDEYDALPTLAQAAVAHGKTIAAEERKDSVTQLGDWRLDGDGLLRKIAFESGTEGRWRWTNSAIGISQQAYAQIQGYYPHNRGLVRRAGGTVASSLWPANVPLPAAPGNINGWLRDLPRVDAKGRKVEHKVRARTLRGQRQVFAIFAGSNRGYTKFDSNDLLAQAAKLQPDLKVMLTYDPDTTRIKARCIKQAPIDIPAFNGVGRVHQIGFDLRTADDGSMSLQCQPILIRIRCKNASLVQVKGKRHAFRHVGKFESLQEQMAQAIQLASEAIGEMARLWSRAAAEHFLDSETGQALSVEETIARLVHGEYIPTGGLSPEDAISAYMAAYHAEESPASAQGVIMAIQRAAHESSWKTKWADDEVEEAASNLLYQTVSWRLDEPENDADAAA